MRSIDESAVLSPDIKVEVMRYPTAEDWARCKLFALNTVNVMYDANKVPSDEWKKKMLTCRHSPIRTLMFTIRLEIPYYVSTHFVRHKHGVEHFVVSQRNDRQGLYDRRLAPQGAVVTHIMDINAEALLNMAHKRLCSQADPTTRYVMARICLAVEKVAPEFKGFLKPQCKVLGFCPEVFGNCKEDEKKIDSVVYGHTGLPDNVISGL